MSLQRPLKCACYAVGTIQPAIRLCEYVVRLRVEFFILFTISFLLRLYCEKHEHIRAVKDTVEIDQVDLMGVTVHGGVFLGKRGYRRNE